MRSVEESESMTGNSSAPSAIDFPTLCHRLKLKRSKSYGQSMKTMLPWRPTLSKTLTKFEFLNDAIKEQVEMILRALEYEMEQGKVLDEFFFSAAGKFRTAIGKSWAAEISSRRNSILARKQN